MTATEGHMDSMDGLRFRVGGLEKEFGEMRAEVNAGFAASRSDTHAAMSAMRSDNDKNLQGVTGAIHSLQASFSAREKTNWPVMISFGGLMMGVMVVMGGLIYRPIQADQQKIEDRIERLDRDVVPRSEMSERWKANERFMDSVASKFEQVVPRSELQERWRNSERWQDEVKKHLEKLENDSLEQARRGH